MVGSWAVAWVAALVVVMVGCSAVCLVEKMDGLLAGLWDHLSVEKSVVSLAFQWADLLVVKTTTK